LIMSKAAFHGECTNVKINPNRQYVAFVAFYGGLPPNVTKDLSVKSIGQGNSLVDASTKGLQSMATVCSALKYFGKVFIGVARDEDKQIILSLLNSTSEEIQAHVNVIQFKTNKPAFLPFHMIAWGQSFIKHFNCQRFYDPATIVSPHTISVHRRTSRMNHHGGGKGINSNNNEHPGNTEDLKGFHVGQVDIGKLEQELKDSIAHNPDDYQICYPGSYPKARGSPIKVIYVKNTTFFDYNSTQVPLRYVYYTECDQIIKFDSWMTFQAISHGLNDSSLFVGRRKEKNAASDPLDYMGNLNMWRECGSPGYSLSWPSSHYVQQDNT